MKFTSVPKTKKSVVEAVKPNLPKGWSLYSVSNDRRWFFVNIPINQHFASNEKDKAKEDRGIRKLEKATGFENNGGGCLVGGSRYTLDFYLDVADGSPDTDGNFIPEHIVRRLTK